MATAKAAASTVAARSGGAQAAGGGGDKSKKKKREKDNEAEEARKKREYEEQQAAWRSITWAKYKPDLRWPLETVSDDIDLAADLQQAAAEHQKTQKSSKTAENFISPHGSLEFSFDNLLKKSEIWDGVEKQRPHPQSMKVKVPLEVQRQAHQCIYSRIFSAFDFDDKLGTFSSGEKNQKRKSHDEQILDAYKFADEQLKARRSSKNWSMSMQLGRTYEATLMQDWQFIFDSARLNGRDKMLQRIIPLCVQACQRIALRAQNQNLINNPKSIMDKPYWNPIRSFAGYLMKHSREASTNNPYGYHFHKFCQRVEQQQQQARSSLDDEIQQQIAEQIENARRVVAGSIEEGEAIYESETDEEADSKFRESVETEKSDLVVEETVPTKPPPNDFWTRKINMK